MLFNRFFFIICLLLAALGFCCCTQAFSGCSQWGLLSSCGAQTSHCSGISCRGAQALDAWALETVAHSLSCPSACGIFPDQGSNPCSQPLDHQGSPSVSILSHLICGCEREDGVLQWRVCRLLEEQPHVCRHHDWWRQELPGLVPAPWRSDM